MIRKFTIATLILFSSIVYVFVKKYTARYITPYYAIKHKPITPQNTIITFDLHDVIVNYDYTCIVKTFFASKGKLKLILAMLNPLVWYSIAQHIYNHSIAEQYIIGLGKKHKSLEPYIPLGIKIANCQTLNPNMLSLIKQLKQMGYTLHLFSNIGSTIYQDLQKKLPHLLEQFDHVILPSQENGYVRKPHHNAFTHYLFHNKAPDKQIIFVDDKIKNVKKATQYGIIGLHFKNYAQLTCELQKLGILPF